jgi:hypothetical protein
MEKQIKSPEEQMMEALSMGMYGRPSQNRCSVLNQSQRERLKVAAMEMVQGNHKPEPTLACTASPDYSPD